MQWDSSPGNAGFSPDAELKPWLPVSSNVREINVKDQIADKNSMLSFYKRLLQLRKDYHCLQVGDMSNIFRDEKNCLYYSRNLEKQNLGIILNFEAKDISIVNPYPKDAGIICGDACTGGSLITHVILMSQILVGQKTLWRGKKIR